MPTVNVNIPNVKQGANVSIPYLGKFKNASSNEVSQKTWDRFVRLSPNGERFEGLDSISFPEATSDDESSNSKKKPTNKKSTSTVTSTDSGTDNNDDTDESKE